MFPDPDFVTTSAFYEKGPVNFGPQITERKLAEFYNAGSKMWGLIQPSSDFDRKYLRNGSRYLKSESQCFQIQIL